MIRPVLLVAVCLMLSSCSSIGVAEMRLPSTLVDTSRTAIDGIGGGRHGRFSFGEYSGGYKRGLDRIALFETLISKNGGSEFYISGPGISSTIEASCKMRERVLNFGDLEFKPKSMAYRCQFTAEGQNIPARFELQEVHNGLAGAMMKNERRGEIGLAGEIVQIRSVHKMAGSPIEMANPIGYVFKQGGQAIGAVELNGKPVVIIPEHTDLDQKRVLSVAALALAVFWDPAVVQQ